MIAIFAVLIVTVAAHSLSSCKKVVCDSYFYFWSICACIDDVAEEPFVRKLQPPPPKIAVTRTDGLPFESVPEGFPLDLSCRIINHRLKIQRDEQGTKSFRVEIEGVPEDKEYAVRVFLLHEMEMFFVEDMDDVLMEAQQTFPINSVESCFPELRASD